MKHDCNEADERIRELETEVERLKEVLHDYEESMPSLAIGRRLMERGGRESGGGDTQGRSGSGHEASGSDSRSQAAAANPAARCDACWEGRSHTHDARKKASP